MSARAAICIRLTGSGDCLEKWHAPSWVLVWFVICTNDAHGKHWLNVLFNQVLLLSLDIDWVGMRIIHSFDHICNCTVWMRVCARHLVFWYLSQIYRTSIVYRSNVKWFTHWIYCTNSQNKWCFYVHIWFILFKKLERYRFSLH